MLTVFKGEMGLISLGLDPVTNVAYYRSEHFEFYYKSVRQMFNQPVSCEPYGFYVGKGKLHNDYESCIQMK
jgi:hypothetical protein